MTVDTIIAAAKRSPAFAAIVKAALAERAPVPADLNSRVLAARKTEPVSDRAQRLTGHYRGAARPMSDAPVVAPRVTAGAVADPPNLVDRIRQLRSKGA